MTYRRPASQKGCFPFILCGIIAFGAMLLWFGSHTPGRNRAIVFGLTSLAVVFGIVVKVSLMVSTSAIDVDDAGIRWKEGEMSGSFRWDEISALTLEGASVGLLEKASGR